MVKSARALGLMFDSANVYRFYRNSWQCDYLKPSIDEIIINETLYVKNLKQQTISDTGEIEMADTNFPDLLVNTHRGFQAIETERLFLERLYSVEY